MNRNSREGACWGGLSAKEGSAGCSPLRTGPRTEACASIKTLWVITQPSERYRPALLMAVLPACHSSAEIELIIMCLYIGHIAIKITVLQICFIVRWVHESFAACVLARFFSAEDMSCPPSRHCFGWELSAIWGWCLPTGAAPAAKCHGSTRAHRHMSLAALWPKSRASSPGRMMGRHGAAAACPHVPLGCRAAACEKDVCRLHCVRTCLLVDNLMVHICRVLCNWMTAHRGLGINYTLERRVAVRGAVVLGKTLSLPPAPGVCAAAVRGAEPWPAACTLAGLLQHATVQWHVSGAGLLPTGWVL